MSSVKLHIDDVSLSFGGIKALQHISFDVREGEIVSVIGPNGAGKTSLINSINGFYKPQSGRILFGGRDITKLPPYKRAQLGISRTFQNIALYTNMTALDNLMAARHLHMKSNMLTGALFIGPAQREEIEHRVIVEEIIEFLEMEAIRKSIVGTLSYGLRKRVELGRALALEPELLLLDEPTAGLDPDRSESFVRLISSLHAQLGLTVVLVTHDLDTLAGLATRVAVLAEQRILALGTIDEITQVDHPFIRNFFCCDRAQRALQSRMSEEHA